MQCNLDIRNDVYIINNWISSDKVDKYVFVGKDSVVKPDALKLKDKYTNTINTIQESIYIDDTINTVLNKIHIFIKTVEKDDIADLYVWSVKEKTTYDVMKIVNILFDGSRITSKQKFIDSCCMVFDVDEKTFIKELHQFGVQHNLDYKNAEHIEYNAAKTFLIENKQIKYLYETLLFSYDHIFNINPLKRKYITALQNINAIGLNHNTLIDFGFVNNEINLICKSNFSDDIYNVYFKDLARALDKTTLKTIDNVVEYVNTTSFESLVDECKCLPHKLEFIIQPYIIDIIDLQMMFNYIQTSLLVPVIAYKMSSSSINVKTHTHFINTTNENLITKVNNNLKNIDNKKAYIQFLVHLSEHVYYYITLYSNGILNVYIDLTKEYDLISFDDIYKSLDHMKVLNIANHNIQDLQYGTFNFFNNQYVKINKLHFMNHITFLEPIPLDKSILQDNIDNMLPYYTVIDTKNTLTMEYKRSNYLHQNDIGKNALYDLIHDLESKGTPYKSILSDIKSFLKCDDDMAKKEYDRIKRKSLDTSIPTSVNVFFNSISKSSIVILIFPSMRSTSSKSIKILLGITFFTARPLTSIKGSSI